MGKRGALANKYIRALLLSGSIAGAVGAIVTTWHLLGWDTLAWSSDIQRLNMGQTTIAIDLYSNQVRSLLAVAPPTDPVARQNWDEEVRRARQQLDEAQRHRIELSR